MLMRVLHLHGTFLGEGDIRVDEGAPSTRDILGREDVLMRVLHLHGTFLGEGTC